MATALQLILVMSLGMTLGALALLGITTLIILKHW